MDPQSSERTATDVFILCGGQGTRLRSVVSDKPKVLVEVGGKPFLDILLEDLFHQGFKRIVLGVGYLRSHIIERYQGDKRIFFSEEEKPMGTGGAVKYAAPLITSEHLLVMNGDSFCEVDYACLQGFHFSKGALLSMVLTQSTDRTDTGNVTLDASGRIIDFQEKSGTSSLINAGIYLMHRDALTYMPSEDVFSIEHDFFPSILKKPCYGFVMESKVMDIGTPERYHIINAYFRERFRDNPQ